MTAYEATRGAIRAAKQETDEQELVWPDAARQRWVGYVAALSQVGVLDTGEYLTLLREELGVSEAESEYALYVQETNLADAEDLVDLQRRQPEPVGV